MAVLAGWYHVPAPPALDGERWFKTLLATLLRGRVEREGGEAPEWEARVVRFVPYHPAGRLPERKVAALPPPGLSVPGELALIESLARESDLEARWRRMYDLDEAGLEARLQDPLELGDVYDPARWLGPGASWDALADWGADESAAFLEACRRRVPARWVVVRGEGPAVPDVVGPLVALTEASLGLPFPEGTDRLVVVAEGDAVRSVLDALLAAPEVRDRVLAVLAVGGRVMADPEWLTASFTPAKLDTELNRVTPYLSVTWYDRRTEPPGVPGLPIAEARFPRPTEERAPSAIEAVDLGLLPADPELPTDLVARALYALVCLQVTSRQG